VSSWGAAATNRTKLRDPLCHWRNDRRGILIWGGGGSR
jgi:hypothetical protein